MAPSLVWVLVPTAAMTGAELDYYSDYSQSHAEFERAFQSLETAWRWQPVTMATAGSVIETIAADSEHSPLVFNLCDGDEQNGIPGISVIRQLRDAKLRFTGADEYFYDITTSKIDMKRAFDAAGVRNASWEVVPCDNREALHGIFERHGSPLIVKPAVSAGSMGITTKSVVANETELHEQLALLQQGYQGWNLVSGGVIAERFIAGPEFTTMIVGSAAARERATVYPSVQRVFHESLPAAEQFLSYDRLWEVYEREAPIAGGEYLWQYRPAAEELQARLGALAWDAYAAVGGRGYTRVDIRMDAETGELYVLEVNAQCGISEDEDYTSIGAILRFAGVSFASLVQSIMDDAVA